MNCDYEVVCSTLNTTLQFSQLSLVFSYLNTLFYQKQHLAFHSPSKARNFALRELMFCVHLTYIDSHGKSLWYKTNQERTFSQKSYLEQLGPVHLPKGTHGRQKAPSNVLEYANHGNLTTQFSRNPLLFPKMTNLEMKI